MFIAFFDTIVATVSDYRAAATPAAIALFPLALVCLAMLWGVLIAVGIPYAKGIRVVLWAAAALVSLELAVLLDASALVHELLAVALLVISYKFSPRLEDATHATPADGAV